MTLRRKKPTTIAEYIQGAPKESREKLRQIHACIRRSAPGSTESIKWGMPAISYRRILVMFAGYKHHVGFYPTPSVMKAFGSSLKQYETGKGSIQFPLDKRLPVGLIARMVKFRIKESLEKDGKWRS